MVAATFRFYEELNDFLAPAPLRPADKASVLDRLPSKVREHYEDFSACDACGRVYWGGSHWRNMCRLLDGMLVNSGT